MAVGWWDRDPTMKYMGNIWEIYGEYMGNIWGIYGNICFISVSTSNYEGSCSEHMVADFFMVSWLMIITFF